MKVPCAMSKRVRKDNRDETVVVMVPGGFDLPMPRFRGKVTHGMAVHTDPPLIDKVSPLPNFTTQPHDPLADHGRRRGTVQIGEGSGDFIAEVRPRRQPAKPTTNIGTEHSVPVIHRRHGKQVTVTARHPGKLSSVTTITGNTLVQIGRGEFAEAMARVRALFDLSAANRKKVEVAMWSEFGKQFDLNAYALQMLHFAEKCQQPGLDCTPQRRSFTAMWHDLDAALHRKNVEPNPLSGSFWHSGGVA